MAKVRADKIKRGDTIRIKDGRLAKVLLTKKPDYWGTVRLFLSVNPKRAAETMASNLIERVA